MCLSPSEIGLSHTIFKVTQRIVCLLFIKLLSVFVISISAFVSFTSHIVTMAILNNKMQKSKGKRGNSFTIVTLSNGTKKARCQHCKPKLTYGERGTTPTLKRNLFICKDLLDELAAPTRPVEMDMGTWFMKPTRRVEGMHENPNF
uniref:Uncharacterized protein n=1 Tax=Lactuca sativa TaxID=4236 RepID=A0A9R1WQT5_LACSA|nr:hypothetical protein LSAT_V11C100031910 [Lactuca sativa]